MTFWCLFQHRTELAFIVPDRQGGFNALLNSTSRHQLHGAVHYMMNTTVCKVMRVGVGWGRGGV